MCSADSGGSLYMRLLDRRRLPDFDVLIMYPEDGARGGPAGRSRPNKALVG